MRRWVVLFLKEPRAGQVKTRLGREIGMTAAAWWFRHQSARLIRRLDDPRWQLALAVAPDRAAHESCAWPRHLPRWPQGPGDLGARMGRIFRSFPPGPIIVVGADVPDLTAAHIAEAFRLLGRHEAVLGPATDGGYWLVGLRRGAYAVPAGLFRGVRWSTGEAMADTIATLAPLNVGYCPALRDIDTADDLYP